MMEKHVEVRREDLQLMFDILIDNGMFETEEECRVADRISMVLAE